MFFTVTMTEDITEKGFALCPWTPHQIQRSTPMGPTIHGPCPIRVRDVVVKCHWCVAVVFLV